MIAPPPDFPPPPPSLRYECHQIDSVWESETIELRTYASVPTWGLDASEDLLRLERAGSGPVKIFQAVWSIPGRVRPGLPTPPPPPDASSDASADAPPEAPPEATVDAPPEASPVGDSTEDSAGESAGNTVEDSAAPLVEDSAPAPDSDAAASDPSPDADPGPAPGSQPEEASEAPGRAPPPRDAYSVDAEGRFVGHDDFVVPRDFAEFHAQFPDHVRRFVNRKFGDRQERDREDICSALTLHLMELPEGSKFSKPGANGRADGCRDRIQTFDPAKTGGANRARFLKYVNNICLMYFLNIEEKRERNPITRRGTVSIDRPVDPDGDNADEDHLAFTRGESGFAERYKSDMERHLLAVEFRDFVHRWNPEIDDVLAAISITESFVEARKYLGMDERLFDRARTRLKQLRECFEDGRDPEPERKAPARPASSPGGPKAKAGAGKAAKAGPSADLLPEWMAEGFEQEMA